ncbi:GAP family protein [Nocardioides sp.]|uniref:GAP family protein n=1 Tax=Nocardioides sp. TaxID=35761 RepID=UPI003D1247A9
MGEVLGEILPLAVAIAASPFPVIPAILLLFTRQPRAASTAFLAGWVVGILVGTLVFTTLATVLERGETPVWAIWLRIVLGLALVILGVVKWLGRGKEAAPPGWMQSLETADARKALSIGLLLSVANPKVLLLSAAAGLYVGGVELTLTEFVVAVAAFTAVAASSVAVPVLGFLVVGERMLPPLARAKDWLITHNAAVMAVVIVVIGCLLVSKGFGEL